MLTGSRDGGPKAARSPFSEQELSRRLDRITQQVLAEDLDLVLLNSADHVYYASGVPLLSEWGRPLWCAFTADRSGVLIGAEIERENMEQTPAGFDVRCYGDDENVWQASLELVAEFGKARSPRRMGIERSLLTLGVYEGLEDIFPECELVEVGPAIAEVRLIKSAEEIEILRLGAEVAQAGASAFMDALEEGVTELEVVSIAVAEMNRTLAAEWPDGLSSSYAYCQLGDGTMIPHLHASGRRLRRGDVVALNVFPVLSGYCMELERTLVFGEGSEMENSLLATVTEAFEVGKQAVAPGVAMSAVDAKAREVLDEAGLTEYIRHGTGHAHGIMIGAAGREELGELRSYNHRPLAAGMACSVEPGVYVPGVGGFRHSDVMLLGDDGAECLTQFPAGAELSAG